MNVVVHGFSCWIISADFTLANDFMGSWIALSVSENWKYFLYNISNFYFYFSFTFIFAYLATQSSVRQGWSCFTSYQNKDRYLQFFICITVFMKSSARAWLLWIILAFYFHRRQEHAPYFKNWSTFSTMEIATTNFNNTEIAIFQLFKSSLMYLEKKRLF